MDDFDPFTLPSGFDPLGNTAPPPPRRRRGPPPAMPAGPAAPPPPMPEPPPDPTANLAQRLTEAEAKIAALEARLEALDAATTERLDDQMARLVRTVLGLLEGRRGGGGKLAERALSR